MLIEHVHQGAGIYRCTKKRGVAQRSEPNETSSRSHGPCYGETKEAVALVDGLDHRGNPMLYLQWKSGSYSPFVKPFNESNAMFTLVQSIAPSTTLAVIFFFLTFA